MIGKLMRLKSKVKCYDRKTLTREKEAETQVVSCVGIYPRPPRPGVASCVFLSLCPPTRHGWTQLCPGALQLPLPCPHLQSLGAKEEADLGSFVCPQWASIPVRPLLPARVG